MSHLSESGNTPSRFRRNGNLQVDSPTAEAKHKLHVTFDKRYISSSGCTDDDDNDKGTNNLSEIEQLRYRISQLEHLIAMPPSIQHTTSTSTYNYASISVHPAVPGPFHSTTTGNNMDLCGDALVPYPDVSTISGGYETAVLLHRTSQLESLLAGSEIDNRNVKEQLELLNVSKNRQKMEFLEEMKRKDLEIQTVQEKLTLAEIKDAKSKKKLAAIENYINTLPSEDELNQLQVKVNQLASENDFLRNRLENVKTELSKTQREYMQKERDLQDALTRLEDLKPLEEAQASLFTDFGNQSDTKANVKDTSTPAYFSNEANVMNLVTLQKSHLIQSEKIIKALRSKLLTRDVEKSEMILALADRVKCIGDLQEQVTCLQIENENISEREQRCAATKNALAKECDDLKAVIEKMETSNDSRRHQTIKLVHLTTQVGLCCSEVQQLVQLCQSICKGEEPSLEDLVGFNSLEDGNDNDNGKDAKKEDDDNNLNLEWIVQKIVDVCKVRKDVQDLKTKINDLYTDTIAQDVEKCNVQ